MALNRRVRGFLLSVPVGAAGGAASGFLIILVAHIISAFGAAGFDPRPAVAFLLLGALYGCVIGAAVVPVAYMTHVHRLGFERAMAPAFIGTVGGALLAMLIKADGAIVGGCLGLFAGLTVAEYIYKRGGAM